MFEAGPMSEGQVSTPEAAVLMPGVERNPGELASILGVAPMPQAAFVPERARSPAGTRT